MFTGIIECLGSVVEVHNRGTNKEFSIKSDISSQLKIDQSVSHDGVCLTVTEISDSIHKVTAVKESILKTNLDSWLVGREVNLERCVSTEGRFDGHFVQGHVDQTTTCVEIEEINGSWYFTFGYTSDDAQLLVPQGSVCINGVSLTIAKLTDLTFTVAIIPYTYEHTTFKQIKVNDTINLEFDIIGKYIKRNLELRK